MFERTQNTSAFTFTLIMCCVIETSIWWDILNSYMARRSFAFPWILQKNFLDNISSKSQKRQRLIAFTLVNTIQYPWILTNNIYHSNKWGPPPFFHSDTNPELGHPLIHSIAKTHVLVITVQLICLLFLNIYSFNYVTTPSKSLLGWQDSREAIYTALLSL